MRGDMQPHSLHHDNLQNDSSSGSSSPNSNTSHEEALDNKPEILPQKVVYNFSIPEFINHEPRIDRDERSRMGSVRRKRNRVQRQQEPQTRDDVIEAPVIVQATKRQRRAAAAAAAVAVASLDEEDRDDDCHRRNVPVIDLTGVDSHDEYTHVHSDSEHNSIREDRSSIFRPFRPRDHEASYTDLLSNLERHQHHLPARERHERLSRLYFRSPSLQRLHRIQQLRRRNEAHRQSSRQIITDGPRFTEDMLVRTPELANPTTPERSEGNADDSVLVVNEIRGGSPEDDHAIAQRMQSDPTYSPPYFAPQHASNSRLNGSSFQLIQERFRALRQRRELTSSSHMAQIQHMRQLLSRDGLQHATPINSTVMGLRSQILRSQTTSNEANNSTANNNEATQQPGDVVDSNEQVTAARMNAYEIPREDANNSDDSGDGEVEFIGEWNSTANNDTTRPRNFHPALVPLSLNSPIYPFPDLQSGHHFLRLLPTPPRLHHIYQENYEALLNLAETLGPGKPRGLVKTEIDRIPSFRFSSNTAKETNAKCVVCISEYSNREKLRRLPCSHDFHAKCIDKWLKANKTCPVCRDEVKVPSTE